MNHSLNVTTLFKSGDEVGGAWRVDETLNKYILSQNTCENKVIIPCKSSGKAEEC